MRLRRRLILCTYIEYMLELFNLIMHDCALSFERSDHEPRLLFCFANLLLPKQGLQYQPIPHMADIHQLNVTQLSS
jgi:hypothetical protein